MLKIFGNEISMTRGDTARLVLSLFDADGKNYSLKEGDSAYFTVANPDGAKIISKEIKEGEVVIFPNDTGALDYGVYDYDIEVVLANGDVCTVIVSTFSVCKEVRE